MKLSGELDYRIRYDVEHDLFHAQNVFNDEYIKPTFIEYVQKLEQENTELKTKKIPQLERRIASIRGSHRVDIKKLNAGTEQVERLKKENAKLEEKLETGIALKDEEIGCIQTDFNTFKSEAKEIISELLSSCFGYNSKTVNYEVKAKAEQFLKEE